VLVTFNLFAQTETEKKGLDAITEGSVYGQLEFLSSEWTEGRETASKGIDMAADYIASIFKVIGLNPAGDVRTVGRRSMFDRTPPKREQTYFQNFELIEYSPGNDMALKVHFKEGDLLKTISFNYRTDFTVNVSDYAEEYTAPVVFVGYGITDEEKGYDDFANIDVKGKLVLRLAGYPGHLDEESKAAKHFNIAQDFMAMRNLSMSKNTALQNSGAVGILEVNYSGNTNRSWAVNKPYRWNLPHYEGDTPPPRSRRRMRLVSNELSSNLSVIATSNRIANLLVKGSGLDIEKFEKAVAENLTPASRVLYDKKVSVKTSVETKIVTTQNVIGYIEGENPDETVVIGGHYDHLGKYGGYIWNGADDNASGTVAAMEIAKAFLATGVKPKKTVIFAAWSAEEKGLLGSRYYVANPFNPPRENIIMNMNFDMIARDAVNDKEGNMTGVTYTSHAVQLKDFLENDAKIVALNATIRASSQPRGGSDFAPFAEKNIPIISHMAAFHSDYHQPTDDIGKVNLKKMTRIIKLGFLTAWKVANLDGKLTWDKDAKGDPPRRPF